MEQNEFLNLFKTSPEELSDDELKMLIDHVKSMPGGISFVRKTRATHLDQYLAKTLPEIVKQTAALLDDDSCLDVPCESLLLVAMTGILVSEDEAKLMLKEIKEYFPS